MKNLSNINENKDLINKEYVDNNFSSKSDLNSKQDTLVSGINIKTINHKSIIGEGNINIQGTEGGIGMSGEGIESEIFNDYQNNKAVGKYSHSEGLGTEALNEAEHAEGKYNKSHTNTISSVGVGTSNEDRKNAIEIHNDGSIFIKGIGDFNGIDILNAQSLQQVILQLCDLVFPSFSNDFSNDFTAK